MIRKAEYVVNLGIFILFLVALLLAQQFPKAAAAYPSLICWVGMALTVVLTVRMAINDALLRKDSEKLAQAKEELKSNRMTSDHFKSIALFLGVLLVYIFSITKLGYFISTITYLIVAMSLFKKKFTWVILLVSAVYPLVMYLVFDKFLHLVIPHGIFY